MEMAELCYGRFQEDLGINLVLFTTINLEGVFGMNEWMFCLAKASQQVIVCQIVKDFTLQK